MFTFPFAKPGKRPEDRPFVVHPMIDLQSVSKSYRTAVGDYQALKHIDLQIHAGEFMGIIGKSGSGKSTLLNMITGIDHPARGRYMSTIRLLRRHNIGNYRSTRVRTAAAVSSQEDSIPRIGPDFQTI